MGATGTIDAAQGQTVQTWPAAFEFPGHHLISAILLTPVVSFISGNSALCKSNRQLACPLPCHRESQKASPNWWSLRYRRATFILLLAWHGRYTASCTSAPFTWLHGCMGAWFVTDDVPWNGSLGMQLPSMVAYQYGCCPCHT